MYWYEAGFKFDSIKKCLLILQHWRASATTDTQTSEHCETYRPTLKILCKRISAMNLFAGYIFVCVYVCVVREWLFFLILSAFHFIRFRHIGMCVIRFEN